jgi:protein O-GlcNAc transferase
MDPLSYFLASARLAPIQCSVPGHPVTTGIGNMDYYFQCKDVEPGDVQSQYSENVILIDNFSKFPTLPDVQSAKDPSDFGLPTGARFYLCPMMLQKMHPEFDSVFAQILELDSNGVIVLFETKEMPWKKSLIARLENVLTTSQMERVRFLPYIRDRSDFIATLKMGHVLLDPFHFGIGSTSAFLAAAQVPFVTWEGTTLRGRIASWLSRIFECPEALVLSRGEYAARAVEIACDDELQTSIRSRIQANRYKLFDENFGISEFCRNVERLIDEMRSSFLAADAELQFTITISE